VIGLRARIGEGAHIDASYMMGADYYQTIEDMLGDRTANRPRIGIGENAIIRRAIIDKNARIGMNVRLLNEAAVARLTARQDVLHPRPHHHRAKERHDSGWNCSVSAN
jgi:glucose-1-phosphate adenylyltransferase